MTGGYRTPAMNRGPFYVFMAALDHINKACLYAFPTTAAAQRFAASHRVRFPGRAVVVREAGA